MPGILMMGMSLRKDSFNKKLIQAAKPLVGADAEVLMFNDFPMPVYDADVEASIGIPDPVKELAKKILATRALILSTPEYNGSIPGPFKNAIDWVSRVKPMPWEGKPILLLGASPGGLGAVRSLWHSRVPLEVCGAHVFPEMFGLAKAATAFLENGSLAEKSNEEKLKVLVDKFLRHLS